MSHELKTPLNVISSSNQLMSILHKEEIRINQNSLLSYTVKKKNIVSGKLSESMGGFEYFHYFCQYAAPGSDRECGTGGSGFHGGILDIKISRKISWNSVWYSDRCHGDSL